MGIMDPNDQPKGSLVDLDFESEDPIVLLDSIKRPVHFEKKDLNGDGLVDLTDFLIWETNYLNFVFAAYPF